MIDRLFGVFFKSRKKDQASDEAVEVLRRILENEAATQKMRLEAEASRQPYVLLRPSVPLPARDIAGWFGGAPLLPDHVAWPEIDGEPLRFACQIDLSALPANIWSGLGPRRGWLAFFLHPENPKPRVLQVDGDLRPRQGPAQSDASWLAAQLWRAEAGAGAFAAMADHDHGAGWRDSASGRLAQGQGPGVPRPKRRGSPGFGRPRLPSVQRGLACCIAG